jgi:hypothetical protein
MTSGTEVVFRRTRNERNSTGERDDAAIIVTASEKLFSSNKNLNRPNRTQFNNRSIAIAERQGKLATQLNTTQTSSAEDNANTRPHRLTYSFTKQ